LGRSSPFLFSSLSAIEHPQPESTTTTTSPPDPSTQRETSPYLTLPSFTRRRRQSADRCSEASRRSHRPTLHHPTPLTTSTLNQSAVAAQNLHRPRHGPALQAPDAAQDATTGTRVPACTRAHSRRSAHGRARHRAPVTTRTSPCTLARLTHRVTHRFTCTRAEYRIVPTLAASTPTPRPHH
jgi:hypothetical protein